MHADSALLHRQAEGNGGVMKQLGGANIRWNGPGREPGGSKPAYNPGDTEHENR